MYNEEMISNNQEEIKSKVWKVEQEILDVIHKICIENELKYTLAYGTLLGAVRHGGFIPWDDDIDIIMPREDYEKLVRIWDSVAPRNFLLQDYRKDLDDTNNFVKIRKNHTTFIQSEDEKKKIFHKGIFVDIFPADRVAKGKIAKKVQYVACAINLLYTRGYTSGSGGLVGCIERILLKANPKSYPKKRLLAEKVLRHWNKDINAEYMVPCTIKDCRIYFPSEMFSNIDKICFNKKEYCAIREWDYFLKIVYGDYMKLPPIDERIWTHHPILIDFENNYEELGEKLYHEV